MSDSELQLIQSAQQGDAEACAALYDRNYDAVYRYCYYRVQDVTLAQDLTSEVFVRMVDKLDTFQARGRPLLAWLYTIARNLIVDTQRRDNRVTQVPLGDVDSHEGTGKEELLQHAQQRLDAACLAAALNHLTEDQRQVILLRFIEGLSTRQVSGFVRKTEGAVKALQHRALKSLRRALEAERCYEH